MYTCEGKAAARVAASYRSQSRLTPFQIRGAVAWCVQVVAFPLLFHTLEGEEENNQLSLLRTWGLRKRSVGIRGPETPTLSAGHRLSRPVHHRFGHCLHQWASCERGNPPRPAETTNFERGGTVWWLGCIHALHVFSLFWGALFCERRPQSPTQSIGHLPPRPAHHRFGPCLHQCTSCEGSNQRRLFG